MPYLAVAGAHAPGEEGFIRQTTCSGLREAQDWAGGVAGRQPAYVTNVLTGVIWRAAAGQPWAIWQENGHEDCQLST